MRQADRSVPICDVATVCLLAALAMMSLGVAGCGNESTTSAQNGASVGNAAPPQQVEAVLVQSKKLKSTVNLPAELTPYESVDVYARET